KSSPIILVLLTVHIQYQVCYYTNFVDRDNNHLSHHSKRIVLLIAPDHSTFVVLATVYEDSGSSSQPAARTGAADNNGGLVGRVDDVDGGLKQ
ncbi:hypothetical protein LINGRAHAP2_LOCUS34213, partial [Linum grandiflorum]